ncbi:MAG: hypothetical protein SO253_03555 [Bacilli bacterium]|nr:hypothetical protein [Bacilli bacterium]
MAENKFVKVKLNCIDEKYLLEFNLSEVKSISLYDENMEQLKELFTQIMKDLIKNNLKFKLEISEEAKNGSNQLACDVAITYVDKLNTEIETLIQTDNLKEVREHFS